MVTGHHSSSLSCPTILDAMQHMFSSRSGRFCVNQDEFFGVLLDHSFV